MRGRWIKRVRRHECRLPRSWWIGSGAIWRCKCGVAYEASLGRNSRRLGWRRLGFDYKDGAR